MSAPPAVRNDASPPDVTVTTAWFELSQVACAVTIRVVPSENGAVAGSGAGSPAVGLPMPETTTPVTVGVGGVGPGPDDEPPPQPLAISSAIVSTARRRCGNFM